MVPQYLQRPRWEVTTRTAAVSLCDQCFNSANLVGADAEYEATPVEAQISLRQTYSDPAVLHAGPLD